MSVTTKQPKSSRIYTPAIVQHLQEFYFACQVMPSVGATLGTQGLAKTPAMERAAKAAPRNKAGIFILGLQHLTTTGP